MLGRAAVEMTQRLLLLFGCVLAAGCHARHEERAAPTTASVAPTALASASAVVAAAGASATASASSVAAPSAAPVPFEVRPAVIVKHKTDGQSVFSMVAEPSILLGPKKRIVKVFDCVSKGAPHPDMFGVCVGFQSCAAETPSEPGVLAVIACTGPTVRLLLTQEGRELAFKIAEPSHPLAKRATSRVPLPDGTAVELHPFERRNLTANVDL